MENAWWLVFVAFNACVAFCDLRWRRVPNALLLAALAIQLAWLAAARLGLAIPPLSGTRGWTGALAGLALGLVFFPLWKWRLMGAGDVKYLAVLGLLVGMGPLATALLWGSIPGGVHAMGQAFRMIRRGPGGRPRRGVPYAAYVALAVLSVALMPSSSPWCSWCSSCCFTAS